MKKMFYCEATILKKPQKVNFVKKYGNIQQDEQRNMVETDFWLTGHLFFL